MSKMKALVCRECGKEYPPKAIHVCEMCFGPLEVKYNYDEIKSTISRNWSKRSDTGRAENGIVRDAIFVFGYRISQETP